MSNIHKSYCSVDQPTHKKINSGTGLYLCYNLLPWKTDVGKQYACIHGTMYKKKSETRVSL